MQVSKRDSEAISKSGEVRSDQCINEECAIPSMTG